MNSSVHIAILSLVLSSYLTAANVQSRVLNGKVIRIENSRHSIAILYDNYYKCVGSLVKSDLVVTAACCIIERECMLDASKFLLIAGVGDLSEMESEEAQKKHVLFTHHHSAYDTAYIDIGVVKVDGCFIETDQVKPIPLCGEELREGTPLKISGWGPLDIDYPNSRLHTTEVNIVNLEKCESIYNNIEFLTLICAEGEGTNPSYGDRGAGATVNGKLCGVVHGGFEDIFRPNLYTDVTHPLVYDYLKYWMGDN